MFTYAGRAGRVSPEVRRVLLYRIDDAITRKDPRLMRALKEMKQRPIPRRTWREIRAASKVVRKYPSYSRTGRLRYQAMWVADLPKRNGRYKRWLQKRKGRTLSKKQEIEAVVETGLSQIIEMFKSSPEVV